MAVLKEVYDLTLELLDKRDGSGRLEEARLLNLRAKFPALATAMQLELAQLSGIHLENPLLKTLDDPVDLPDFPAYAVLPYGLAAELARQGGVSELAQQYWETYERRKREIRLEERGIEDAEHALRGLGGV